MVIPVTFFLALAAMIVSYSLGQGGPIAGMVFLFVLFIGATVHYSKPLIQKLKP